MPPSDTTTNDDNFEAAFERLAELGDKPVTDAAMTGNPPEPDPATPATPEPEVTKVEEPVVEPVASDPPVGDPPVTPSAPIVEPKVVPEPVKPAAVAPVEPAKPAPAAPPTVSESPPAEIYTPEEKTLLETYEKDWPDVAKAEALKRRAEYRDLVGFVFQEVVKEFGPAIQAVQALSQRTHLTDLQAAVGDYNDVRDKVVDWVSKQPVYLQTAYNQVVQHGTVEEITDLIARYRADTGTAATAPVPVPAKKVTELPSTVKQAAASLAPVSSKRASPTSAEPSDFDGAFAAFAEKV